MISEIKIQSKQKFINNWGLSVALCLLVITITTIAAPFGATIVIYGPLYAGLYSYFTKINREQKPVFNDVFSGFCNFINTFLGSLLSGIYIFLWSLLFIIPGMIKSYSYSMTLYIMNDDPTITCNDAITKSRNMMLGYKWKLFCLDLSFIGWYILSIFTFGILAILYVIPYHNTARAAFYEKIRNPLG